MSVPTPLQRADTIIRLALLAAALAALLAYCAPPPATAHSWYPPECCSDKDCFPIAYDELEPVPGGYLYTPRNLFFPASKVRDSKDKYLHVCIGTYDFNMGKPLCAFVHRGF